MKPVPKRRPTLRDVAAAAGVSTAVVSYVLSGRGNRANPASPATQRNVLAAAEQLGYAPDVNARSLRRRRTDRVCLITSMIGAPAVAMLLDSLQTEADRHASSVMTLNVDTEHRLGRALDLLRRNLADGVVFADLVPISADDIASIAARGTAVVAFREGADPCPFDVVRVHEEEACEEVLNELLRQGRRRIAYLGHRNGVAAPRYRAYRRALAAADIREDPALVIEGAAEDRVAAYQSTLRLLDHRPGPDAIFSSSDRAAMSAVSALRDSGARVPHDVAVVGVGNIPEGEISKPRLTTIGTDGGQFTEAAQLLFERIEGDDSEPREILYPAQVVWRDSAVRDWATI